jgi:hypothetical protein
MEMIDRCEKCPMYTDPCARVCRDIIVQKDAEIERLKVEVETLRKIPVGLNTHCPNTMQILGAALSGGDVIELAKKLDRK